VAASLGEAGRFPPLAETDAADITTTFCCHVTGPDGGELLMPASIDLAELKRLLDERAQLVEVLPPEEYAEEHLPGAVNIPLKVLDAETTAQLDRSRDVVVYCWDGL
jgi:Rhodanese-like domain